MKRQGKARGSAPGPRWGRGPQTPIYGRYTKMGFGDLSPAGSRAGTPGLIHASPGRRLRGQRARHLAERLLVLLVVDGSEVAGQLQAHTLARR